jgi:SAM-dependent methyltransferase
MVFVSPVRVRGLDLSPEQIAEAERLRESSDLADLEGCWEMQFLECERARTATRDNHLAVLDTLRRHLPEGGRLLDFGAGWGQFVQVAGESGWDATGIEPTPGRALHAREALGLDVRTATLTPGLFPEEHFDAVVSLQVFEHLEDPAAEIDRIASVLRPGGILAIEVPSIASPLVRLMGGAHRHFNPDHFWFFSPDTLQRFVTDHGFSVLECSSPTRRLSVEWVSMAILSQYLPDRLATTLLGTVRRTGLGRVVVGINVRDIVMVVARRRPTQARTGSISGTHATSPPSSR